MVTKEERKRKEKEKEKKAKKQLKKEGSGKKVFGLVLGVGILTLFTVIAILLGRGEGRTHTAGIDFSNYTMWWIGLGAFPVIVGTAAAGIGLSAAMKKYKPMRSGQKWAFVGLFIAVGFGIFYATATGTGVVRAYLDNSKTAQIEIVTSDSGDFTMLGASVESYHETEEGLYRWTRIIAFDDRYRVAVDINCTNFTDADGNSTQLYNSTTALIQGYNVARETVTGRIAPEVQPGDFTTDTGSVTLVFSNIPRQISSPFKQVAYLNVSLLDEDGILLSSWIIHTHPDLEKWVVKTTF